ncbi:hypothetical protein Zmor_024514 [Zophobas morio]|uniref:Reverse transcriptase domain-containing protein n=1 Tax=Zophobas morio TaxID=2755281 RepID=A0AA38M8F3_9CUCU|nr:hypothetical protein Zmor_024514 [Zophobas morio]
MPSILGVPNAAVIDDVLFSSDAVRKKLDKLKVSKSPGPDLITAKLLTTCSSVLSYPLSILMSQSFNSSSLPADWRTATVRPIFKKGDKFDATNYRPISLTSLIVKVMESIIYDRVIKFFVDYQLIPFQQHGFLPGKSIQSNLLCCLSDWTKEIDAGNSIDVVYLDFSKAFDRVPKRRLLHKLQHLGLGGNLLKWIGSFLSERTFRVKVGDAYSRPFEVTSGVPQGSVLGPLLFIAYTADLKSSLISPFPIYKLYNLSSQNQILKQDLISIQKWSSDWLLPLNFDKCNVLYIGNKNPRMPCYMNGEQLVSSDCCRDLGVLVTCDLSWSQHIAHVSKKANSTLFLLRRAFQKSSPIVFAKLYKTFVRPLLEFANSVWSPILQKDILLLESVQRRATRIPFGRVRPQYHERLAIMKILTLSNRRVRGDLITTFQAMSNKSSPIHKLFILSAHTLTRGHSFKLAKEKFKTTVRQHFLSTRVFQQWNSLPEEIVSSQSTMAFKIKYDIYSSQ